MRKTLRCRDVGLDCEFVARGDTEDEVMSRVSEHARAAHGMGAIPAEIRQRARAAIRDEQMERHEPPRTTTGPLTAPKFGSAGSGGAEYERLPEQHDDED